MYFMKEDKWKYRFDLKTGRILGTNFEVSYEIPATNTQIQNFKSLSGLAGSVYTYTQTYRRRRIFFVGFRAIFIVGMSYSIDFDCRFIRWSMSVEHVSNEEAAVEVLILTHQ